MQEADVRVVLAYLARLRERHRLKEALYEYFGIRRADGWRAELAVRRDIERALVGCFGDRLR